MKVCVLILSHDSNVRYIAWHFCDRVKVCALSFTTIFMFHSTMTAGLDDFAEFCGKGMIVNPAASVVSCC